jgi:hypothetical protein
LANVRIRGKIPHSEWPKIAERYASGDSLAAIARSYGCTAPAIRYIIHRTPVKSKRGQASAAREVSGGRAKPIAPFIRQQAKTEMPYVSPERGTPPIANEIWGRINNDIANFLAAVDALFVKDSEGNREALLRATDRLMRASARTRLELERSEGTASKTSEVVRL